jgi:hypothetical protein
MNDYEYCVCGKILFFNHLKNREIMKCPKCNTKHICIEQYYQDEYGYGETIRDLYLTDDYKKRERNE